jgi:hypothetical protein
MLASKTILMRSAFAQSATVAAVAMNKPCLSVLATSLAVVWHCDCSAAAAAAPHGNNYLLRRSHLAAPPSGYPGTARSFRTIRNVKRYFNDKDLSAGGANGNDMHMPDGHQSNQGTQPAPAVGLLHCQVPQRIRQKVVSASDAASLVHDGDTVCVTGFVSQGTYCTCS